MTRTFVLGAVTCALLLPALPALARWEGRVVAKDSLTYPNTPIPDPTGIAYNARNGTFLITDAEVDETPSLWKNKNLFIVGRGGALKAARRLKMTTEPEGVAWWGAKRFLFVVDDDQDLGLRIEVDAGPRDDVIEWVAVGHAPRYTPFRPAYQARSRS